jgi:hypothetical protein
MNKIYIDPNLYLQTDVDSGALTMLGTVVHQFDEPGEYRGTVRHGDEVESVFYLNVDKECPVAAADIDLAKLAASKSDDDKEKCGGDELRGARFSVNPRGYAVFRVSGGPGGYSVNLRRADPSEDTRVFNSTVLEDGARFAARVLRPGTYSITNREGPGKAELTVAYPPKAFSGYRPPEPYHVKVTREGFEPNRIALKPAQGLIFECHSPSRILIALDKPDNGPGGGKGKGQKGKVPKRPAPKRR